MGPVRENPSTPSENRPKISEGAKFESDKRLNPLSPSIYTEILQTDLFTFP